MPFVGEPGVECVCLVFVVAVLDVVAGDGEQGGDVVVVEGVEDAAALFAVANEAFCA